MTDLPTFVNEPIGELRRSSVRDELLAGMAALEPTLPLRVPVWIGDGERHDDALQSTDPGHPDRVVATTARATEAEVDEAVQTATRGFAPPSTSRRTAAAGPAGSGPSPSAAPSTSTISPRASSAA